MRRDEQLSALMDDELSQDELRFLLKGLKTDSEGRDKWRRYHAIADALRDEATPALEVDLSARVAAAIAEQEAAEKSLSHESVQEPAWMKRLVSFAVAASVATVALFVANDRGLIGAPAANDFAVTSQPLAAAPAAARQSEVADWQQVSPEIQQRINRFLSSDDATVAEPGISSQLRLVGHRQEAEAEETTEQEGAAVDVDTRAQQ